MSAAPGYKQYPGHRIAAKPAGVHVQVKYAGETIADTHDAVAVEEGMPAGSSTVAPTVYYVPRKDVRVDLLTRTHHTTYCPFKGDASYYSLKNGPENAVWSYERPYDEMAAIRDRLAFYPDEFELVTAP